MLASTDQDFILVAGSLNPVFRDGNELVLEDIWLDLWVYQREFDEGWRHDEDDEDDDDN